MRWAQHSSCGGRGDTMHILFVPAHGQTALSQPSRVRDDYGVCLGTEMGVDYFTFWKELQEPGLGSFSCLGYHRITRAMEPLLPISLSSLRSCSRASSLSYGGHAVWARNKLCSVKPWDFGAYSLSQHNLAYCDWCKSLGSRWWSPKFRKWHLSWELKDEQFTRKEGSKCSKQSISIIRKADVFTASEPEFTLVWATREVRHRENLGTVQELTQSVRIKRKRGQHWRHVYAEWRVRMKQRRNGRDNGKV